MSRKYVKVTFESNEFEKAFPELAKLDLNESDKIRVALGLPARKARAGAPEGNKNAAREKIALKALRMVYENHNSSK